MDGPSFDTLTRLAATGTPRRSLLASALALIGAGLGLGVVLDAEETAAATSCRKRCRKKCDGKQNEKRCRKRCLKRCQRCLSEGSPCSTDQQCCRDKNLICEIEFGDSGGDKECCRGEGASCTPPGQDGPKCCTGSAGGREFQCTGGTCRQSPPE